jgi:hypothetical protein
VHSRAGCTGDATHMNALPSDSLVALTHSVTSFRCARLIAAASLVGAEGQTRRGGVLAQLVHFRFGGVGQG